MISENNIAVSVIIPIAKNDKSWKHLLPDLRYLSSGDEIIFSPAGAIAHELKSELKNIRLKCRYRLMDASSRGQRALQLNRGAEMAKNNYLWFLHSDSRISEKAISKLKKNIKKNPRKLHFFNLLFLSDGPKAVSANSYGVWFRSHVLRLPFGDQGLCVHRTDFIKLGRFDEKVIYGEDHLFIWKAHQNKIKLSCVGAAIRTSARKYKTNGWLHTTVQHLYLTLKQAFPELLVFLSKRAL